MSQTTLLKAGVKGKADVRLPSLGAGKGRFNHKFQRGDVVDNVAGLSNG